MLDHQKQEEQGRDTKRNFYIIYNLILHEEEMVLEDL